jgi:uncharacterized protein (TIGR03067 family)
LNKPLPSRPNLDHLRRQAKTLLARLTAREPDAVRLVQEHLPDARGKSLEQVLAAGYRLADAQSVIARSTGFASWPALARHVDQLRALEGVWAFGEFALEGRSVDAHASGQSCIVIDGDRFRVQSARSAYEGLFTIDVEQTPHQIDIEFVDGPNAGSVSRGVFVLRDDALVLALSSGAAPRPTELLAATTPGHAFQVLRRTASKASAKPDASTPSGRRDGAMAPRATDVHTLIPMAHVADVEASLAFYGHLGYGPINVLRDAHAAMRWAMLRSGDAAIMLARASGPIDAEQQAVLFYMYTHDVAALRQALLKAGVADATAGVSAGDRGVGARVFPITHPDYMPAGEMRLIDPDGYVILVGQLPR